MNKKIAKIIEFELIVVLAIVLILGILFGYSLAAGKTISDTSTTLRAGLGGATSN